MPDTQFYTTSESGSVYFADQTQWIVDHLVTKNIRMVSHVGDVVNDGGSADQWSRANAAMNILDTVPELPYGVVLRTYITCPRLPFSSSMES